MPVRELISRRAGYLGNVTKRVNNIRGYLLGPVEGSLDACEEEVRKLLDSKARFDNAHEEVINHPDTERRTISSCQDGANRATHAVVSVLDDYEHWTRNGPSVTPQNLSLSSMNAQSSSGSQDLNAATLEMLGRLHTSISSMQSNTVAQAVQIALAEQEQKHSRETSMLHERIEELSKELGKVTLLNQVAAGEDSLHCGSTNHGDVDYRQDRHGPSGVRNDCSGLSVLHSTVQGQGVARRPTFGRGRARGRARPSSILPDQLPSVGRDSTGGDLVWSFAEAATAMKELMSQSVFQNSSLMANMQAPKVTLKTFEGDPLEYASFTAAFDDLVHEAYDNDRSRLLVLIEHCSGSARAAIGSCLHMRAETGYAEARKILERKFGTEHVVTQAWLDKLMGYPQVVEGATLERFATDVEACRNSLRALGSLAELECVGTLQRIVLKLPLHLRNRWRKQLRGARSEGCSRADLLVQLLREAAEDDTDPAFSETVINKVRNTYESRVTPRVNRVSSVGRHGVYAGYQSEDDDDVEAELHTMNKGSCSACRSGQHFTSRCRNYRELTPEGKLEFVKTKRLCLLCLGDTHGVANCPLPWKCQDKLCGGRHHTSLHASFAAVKLRGPNMVGPKPPNPTCNVVEDSGQTECTTYETEEGSAYAVMCAGNLPIAKVTVRHGKKFVNTYALLDSGATITLCRKDIMETLGLKSQRRQRMLISTVNGKTLVNSEVISMNVSECSNNIALPLHNSMVVEKINVSLRGLAPWEQIRKFKHLRNLRFHRGEETHIGLLIGQNNAHLIDPLEVIRGGYYDPYAVGTPLGWVLYGNTKEDFGRGDRDMPPHSGNPSPWRPGRMANTVEAEEEEPGGETVEACVNSVDVMTSQLLEGLEPDIDVSSEGDKAEISMDEECQFVNCTCGDTELTRALEKLASLDQVPEADTLTEDERYVLELWERELRFEDGHVVIPIPFKDDPPALINNFVAAYRALIHLGNQLLKDRQRLAQYRDAVLAYFEKGYAEIVKDATPSLTKFVWYMLHHGVDHPRKPGVTRVVKHGGATYKGFCLNKAVHQGPNLMNNLSEVLTRFRQFEVGTTSDIEGMFNQVWVPENQRDYSRFLFWEDGDPTKRIIVCRMKTHIFGTVWAPAAANFALKKMAELETRQDVKHSISQEFYVDDWPGAHESPAEASEKFRLVRAALARGGFNLIKLASNSREVIKSVEPGLRVKELARIDLDRDPLPQEMLLGQLWRPESDDFGFRVAMEPRPFTRRGMTSCIASIYDPLGLIAPFILPAKLLLQRSSKSGTGWDEELIGSTSEQWSAWLRQLPEIENFRLKRWFGCTRETKQYIHMFSDACERSYGAAAYLAVLRGEGNVTTLVTSKSRVSPPNKLTVPKMEMAGAVLAVKLMQLVRRMFSVFIEAVYFWVDSTIVLILIRKDPDTLKTFMGNRVAYIRSETTVDMWGHVAGSVNPADISSRGESITELNRSKLWLEGPEFLKQDPEQWNKLKLKVLEPCDTSSEEQKVKPVFCGMVSCVDQRDCLVATLEECEAVKAELLSGPRFHVPTAVERATADKIMKRYSTWIKTIRFAVIMAKFAGWWTAKMRQESVLPVERQISVNEITREEVNLLAWEQSMSLSESITKEASWKQLLPFFEGVWRVGGRCEFGELTEEVKHPIILPRTGTVTELLVREAHRAGGHGGADRTLVELRGRYWILGGRPTVRKFIDTCITCKRLRGSPEQQQMAPLPRERVAPRKPAFTHSGVDLFGPITVLVKRSTVKRYGSIFTCFNTRAVHLEPVEDLSASAFLDTVERFCMRRCVPQTLKSDNGTNFVRSEKEVSRAYNLLAGDDLRRLLTDKRIEWSFNTPSASHQGGVWERLIRSVRQIIIVILSEQPVTDARFHTVLCIAEGIMNGRPLTRLTDDVRDLEPLTPGHFTCGGRVTSPLRALGRADTLRQDWKLSQTIAGSYWDQWIAQYLPILQKRPKWIQERDNVQKGELVLIVNDQVPRFDWPLGRIVEVHAGKDGLVRNVTLRTGTGIIKRPIQKVVRLELDVP